MTSQETLAKEANRFHQAHPEVWRYFEQFTFDRINQGFQHYSADAIMHRVRWETSAGSKTQFKISNNHVAYYARAFMRRYPQHNGFFRTRKP